MSMPPSTADAAAVTTSTPRATTAAATSTPTRYTLLVNIHTADGLEHSKGKSFYCKLYVGETSLAVAKASGHAAPPSSSSSSSGKPSTELRACHSKVTRSARRTSASWDETLELALDDPQTELLSIRVKNQLPVYCPCIGACSIDLSRLRVGDDPPTLQTFALRADGEQVGTIQLRLQLVRSVRRDPSMLELPVKSEKERHKMWIGSAATPPLPSSSSVHHQQQPPHHRESASTQYSTLEEAGVRHRSVPSLRTSRDVGPSRRPSDARPVRSRQQREQEQIDLEEERREAEVLRNMRRDRLAQRGITVTEIATPEQSSATRRPPPSQPTPPPPPARVAPQQQPQQPQSRQPSTEHDQFQQHLYLPPHSHDAAAGRRPPVIAPTPTSPVGSRASDTASHTRLSRPHAHSFNVATLERPKLVNNKNAALPPGAKDASRLCQSMPSRPRSSSARLSTTSHSLNGSSISSQFSFVPSSVRASLSGDESFGPEDPWVFDSMPAPSSRTQDTSKQERPSADARRGQSLHHLRSHPNESQRYRMHARDNQHDDDASYSF
ncbi:hypothetical protein PINS_up010391 [Pythium insidiosum]|nr:hypothetical protein PINS_up010391 [Pythium insidiosum]